MTIQMQDTVEEIVEKCPEAVDVLKSLGFDQITNPIMLKTMGKIMTLPKVSRAKNVPLETIIDAFSKSGITILE